MNVDLLHYFSTQGPWAVLFVGGLIYTLNWARSREEYSQKNMEELLDKYDQLSKDLWAIHNEIMKCQQNLVNNKSLVELMQDEYSKHRDIEKDILEKVAEISAIIEDLKK
ncbi:BhlA/UviB family holin-like peptide [Fictibacillus aquaticus]|uniref:Uncharacterized protein n=1 Tax=Fictibacillus aquaticus TaxID=2021314 RepID=A0A235F578_9BACL|nr:BhlA/UviB family holin-like peptide [Fictibacillus aquaticus]OYD56372.1 hypothetical protein CGZ90_17615 [Fictibacillus aquaticus]